MVLVTIVGICSMLHIRALALDGVNYTMVHQDGTMPHTYDLMLAA